jgi:hypothetical protein
MSKSLLESLSHLLTPLDPNEPHLVTDVCAPSWVATREERAAHGIWVRLSSGRAVAARGSGYLCGKILEEEVRGENDSTLHMVFELPGGAAGDGLVDWDAAVRYLTEGA